ncbi:MAG TPA: glycoside hydrolase family 95 protein, partial [Ruminiclostridium sp.]|nr:glycoside hydrolase family 95 protein [Ruminiclostridium sp.]
MEHQFLSYKAPANKWEEALPVGNGKLGGMVYGGTLQECIGLNDDTLWSGLPGQHINPEAFPALSMAQRLLNEGRNYEAQQLIEDKILTAYSQSYLPLGKLIITQELTGKTKGYHRSLCLDTAVCTTRFSCGSIEYCREVLCSYPDGVMAIHITAGSPGSLTLGIGLESLLRHHLTVKDDTLIMYGDCPSNMIPDYVQADQHIIYDEEETSRSIHFAVGVRAVTKGGSIRRDVDMVRVTNADEVLLLLSSGTNFEGYEKMPGSSGRDPAAKCISEIESAMNYGWQGLMTRHIADHSALFNRVCLDLGPQSPLPINERLALQAAGQHDPSLAALMFAYGRYLLIACSRPGSQAANLQGIWNRELTAPWSSNYTTNINTEMNYWPAETANLPECHQPLFDMLEELSKAGSEIAYKHYGCRGFVVHHNTDLWRMSSAVSGKAMWGFWPMGGAWLSR